MTTFDDAMPKYWRKRALYWTGTDWGDCKMTNRELQVMVRMRNYLSRATSKPLRRSHGT